MRRQTWIWLLLLLVVIVVVWLYMKSTSPQTWVGTGINQEPTAVDEMKAIEQEAEVNTPERPVADISEVTTKATAVPSDATRFTIAPGSAIDWLIRKVWGQHKGIVDIAQGDTYVKNGQLVAGTLNINMTSLRTNDGSTPPPDQDFTNSDYFDVNKYPTATFDLISAKDNIIVWILTMKGVSKEISFPATVIVEDDIIAVYSEFALDRTQWGVNGGKGTVSQYIDVTFRLTWTS